jgi:hypothetical protein
VHKPQEQTPKPEAQSSQKSYRRDRSKPLHKIAAAAPSTVPAAVPKPQTKKSPAIKPAPQQAPTPAPQPTIPMLLKKLPKPFKTNRQNFFNTSKTPSASRNDFYPTLLKKALNLLFFSTSTFFTSGFLVMSLSPTKQIKKCHLIFPLPVLMGSLSNLLLREYW